MSMILLLGVSTFALDFKKEIEPILIRYCFDCHGDDADKGDFSLDQTGSLSEHLADTALWMATWKNVRAEIMPPSDKKQPSAEERATLIHWIEQAVFKLDPDNPDPGRVTVRRLNREEYQHTIQDVFGHHFNTQEAFPPDDSGYGFDTIGDALNISPLLMEKYLEAARKIVGDRVAGPPDENGKLPSGYTKIFIDGPPGENPEAYQRKLIQHWGLRIWRRPIEKKDEDRLMALARSPEGPPLAFEEGFANILTALLASPRFLFRSEIQSEPNNPGKIQLVDEFSLASRLSYFLWRSAPDATLLEHAAEGRLRKKLRAEIDRLMQDRKSERFVESFTGQWLQTRNLNRVTIYAARVLGIKDQKKADRLFSNRTKSAMRKETEMLFAHVFKEDRSVLDFLTADYTFLNEDLARTYGIPGVDGQDMRKVQLAPDSPRGGILGQGTFLVITSNPTRTSPVKRGLFVLENLLAAPAPPAPGEVPTVEEQRRKKENKDLTMRELMAVHREDKLCAGCHARFDPIGVALDNFNAFGMWRDEENGKPIEAGGQLITGEAFANAKELSRVLATDRRGDFYRCLTEKLLTFAIGRGVEYYDAPTIDAIVKELEASGGKMSSLIHGVVDSAPFQMRRGDGDPLGESP